jgi:hypothetical protein
MLGTRSTRTGRGFGAAAAEHPAGAAGLGFLTTPLALSAGRLALRFARRNPTLAVVVAAGALAWWGYGRLRDGADERSPGGDDSSASSL